MAGTTDIKSNLFGYTHSIPTSWHPLGCNWSCAPTSQRPPTRPFPMYKSGPSQNPVMAHDKMTKQKRHPPERLTSQFQPAGTTSIDPESTSIGTCMSGMSARKTDQPHHLPIGVRGEFSRRHPRVFPGNRRDSQQKENARTNGPPPAKPEFSGERKTGSV